MSVIPSGTEVMGLHPAIAEMLRKRGEGKPLPREMEIMINPWQLCLCAYEDYDDRPIREFLAANGIEIERETMEICG